MPDDVLTAAMLDQALATIDGIPVPMKPLKAGDMIEIVANLGPVKAVSAHDFSVPVPAGTFFADEQALADFLKGKTCSQCGEPFGARHHQMPALTVRIGDGSEPDDQDAIAFTYDPAGGQRG